jgi:uncharacterized protein (TIGR03067 family)
MGDKNLLHPAAEQLTAFGLGQLDEAALLEIESHLTACAACREAVEQVADDTVVSLLRSTATESDANAGPHEDPTQAAGATPAGSVQAPGIPQELAQHPRYRMAELLGVGGMGAVYKAEHLLMERPVALKVLNRSLTGRPEMWDRFRREIKAAARLTHPNIVHAYDAEQAGDSHFLVMEYVEGKSLAAVVAERGPLPVAEACDCIRQAALGLQHAHERGMVHRDVKPQNLMLTPQGQVKILDFGLARLARESVPPAGVPQTGPRAEGRGPEAVTQVGTVMGTPDYIAPEQACNAHEADIRADIYSLGCTLYDLLAGHAPFPEGTPVDKVLAHVERMPRPLTEIRADVPPALARVVERMLAKDPAARYQTPAEVAEALRAFTAAPSPRRRLRRLAAAALLAAAAAVAGAVIYVQTDRGEFVIETADDDVAVRVNDKGVKIRDQASGREYLLRAGKRDVRTGVYEILVSELPEGIEFVTTRFTVRRGGKATATARLVARADKKRDHELLQGTWRAVSGDQEGKPVPEGDLKSISVTFTGQQGSVTMGRYRGKGTFTLDTTQNPRHITVIKDESEGFQGMQGIYSLEGDTLKLCMGEPRDGRPTEFRSRPGFSTLNLVLRREAAAPRPGTATGAGDPNRLLEVATWGTGFKPITRDGVTADEGGWRIEARGERVVRIYETQPPLEDSVVIFRARMKSAGLKGKAYLEMWCRLPGSGESFSRGVMDPLAGTTDWRSYEIPFVLQKDERPDLFKLNVHLEGAGTVWIKDVALLTKPLPPGLKRPSALGPGGKADTVQAFGPSDKPVTTEGVTADQGGWRIEAKEGRGVNLFEVKDPGVEGCLLIYRARMKSSGVQGKAYLEMWCHLPGDPEDSESFSRGLDVPVSGTTDWASYETPFLLEKGEKPDRVKLAVRIEGKGTVWIRDVELLRAPLPAKP